MNNYNVVIFSTRNSLYFAKLIAQGLGIPNVTRTERRLFGDGERYLRLGINQRDDLVGKKVIFVGSTHTDKDFLELHRVVSTAARNGSIRRIIVNPFFGYSTMEREVRPGEVVTAKENAEILSSIPNTGLGNVFLMMDLHVSGLVHYFSGNCQRLELYAEPILLKAIKNLKLKNFVIGSADLGRTKWVETFANKFKTDIAFISKSRKHQKTKILAVIGDVYGKIVIIYDDMTRSGSTIIQAAEAYLKRGATAVYVVLSHLALNNQRVAQKLNDSPIVKIISTNTHPFSQKPIIQGLSKFEILDASGIYVNEIKKYLF